MRCCVFIMSLYNNLIYIIWKYRIWICRINSKIEIFSFPEKKMFVLGMI